MRFKIFILSTLLLTLVTGMLFYKNLSQIGFTRSSLNIDFDELRFIDQEVNTTAFYLKKTLSADTEELAGHGARIKELLAIINDINRNSPELKFSVDKIKNHFAEKQKRMQKLNAALLLLRKSVQEILPAYNDLVKHNIKFTLDKKDFYRECILDVYMYIAFSHKENEMRIQDDEIILSQILSYATTPNPYIKRFSTLVEDIHASVKESDQILNNFREASISEEMSIIAKYYQETAESRNRQNENLLTFMIIGMLVYLIMMIFILRKR